MAAHGPETGWNATYGDGQAVFSGDISIWTDNWTIDGVVGGGPGSWRSGHGFRVNGHFRINQPDNSVYSWTQGHGSNIKLLHIEIYGTGSYLLEDAAVKASFIQNLHMSHLYTHNTSGCPLQSNLNCRDILWEYCYVGWWATVRRAAILPLTPTERSGLRVPGMI